MDIDVFPNSLEYWGPSGMVFFRNVQVRWMPIQGDTRMTIALERPGASADQGLYSERIPSDVNARFPLPDLSAEYRVGQPWGYVEAAGIVRYMKWDDNSPTPQRDLSGDAVGWGVNLSSNIKISKDVLRLQVVYGAGWRRRRYRGLGSSCREWALGGRIKIIHRSLFKGRTVKKSHG